MSDELSIAAIACNGIDGASGEYLLSATPGQLSRVALGEPLDDEEIAQLRTLHERATAATYGLREGPDPCRLEESGWGVIFAHDADPAIRAALQPLLEARHARAGALYKELVYRPGETKTAFLARHRHGPGPVDPARLPYYLLIVGGPEAIPFRFQYQLDVQFAVGRISFETPGEYGRYAFGVVRAEGRVPRAKKRAVCFGVRNPGDRATQLSADTLVAPIARSCSEGANDWTVSQVIGGDATKAALCAVLNGDAPQLLFSASHGMGFPNGHERQLRHQGALLCQDWPGPFKHRGEIPPGMYFSSDDVGDDASLDGLVVFMFACFGGGTPRLDEFSRQAMASRPAIAPHDFVAALPRRLLGHPGGGALAVIAHVERAWGYSFSWPGAGAQLAPFESTLDRLMQGQPVGYAFEYFNERYAELATVLTEMIEDARFSKTRDDVALAGTWTAHNDSRSYVVLGDPAVSIG
jgi:hypothetical protein